LLVALTTLGACGGTTTASGSVGPGGSSGTGASASTSGTGGSSSSSVDAAPALAAALAPLLASNAFSTTVTVDGASVLVMTGRSAGKASSAKVTTGGKTVQYVRIPPRTWARDGAGAWVLVAADAAPTAPLAALAKPTSVSGDGTAAGSILQAVYPAKALGLTGDPVSVTITLDPTTVEFSYELASGGHTTVSTTTLRPAAADPISAPKG
jgi:hypothetical protein